MENNVPYCTALYFHFFQYSRLLEIYKKIKETFCFFENNSDFFYRSPSRQIKKTGAEPALITGPRLSDPHM